MAQGFPCNMQNLTVSNSETHYQNPYLNFDISYWIAPKPIPNAISEVPYQNFNISHRSFWNWYQEIEIKILISPRIPHFSCNSSSQLQVFLESSSVVPRDCKGTHGLSSSYSLTCVGDESKENRGLSKRRGFEENKIAVRGSAGKVSIILGYNFSFLSLSVLNILSWLKFYFILLSKAKVYYKQKKKDKIAFQSTREVYNKCLKAQKNDEDKQKLHPPQQEPTQSTKSTTEEGPENKNNQNHSYRLQRKASSSPWTDCSSFSKALLFLSIQGATHHTFSAFDRQKNHAILEVRL